METKSKIIIACLVLIIAVGIFLRIYNFDGWLFFQADQARDFNLVSRAINNGPEWLPLLGPKAGGTFLRLGPIFYYFEYLSALIFGIGSPAIMAYPDLFFSILSIPLLFLFLKEFFSNKYSLLLTAGYAICFFEIQYSRFAWNPNSLPFFNLLFFYAVYKFFQTDNGKAKFWWAALIGAAYAIVGQLHFVSMLSLPIALAAIFLIRKISFKNIKEQWLKYLGVILLTCLIFYLPAILSDFQTNGNNTLNFIKSIGQKNSDTTNLASLLQKDAFVFSKYFLVILTGIVDATKITINLFISVLVLLFAAGVFALKRENDGKKKFFIALVFVWFFSYFITYFPLGSKLQPRHFLVILPLAFIFVGLLAHSLEKIFKFKYVAYLAMIVLLVPIITNAYNMKVWFSEISDSQKKISTYRKSSLLKSVGGESWWHLKKTSEFMHNDCEKSRIVMIPPKESYRSLYDYAMEYVGEKRPYSIQWGSFERDNNACFYVIGFAKNDISDRFGDALQRIKYVQFGDMAVTRFSIIDDQAIKKIKNPFKKNNKRGIEIEYNNAVIIEEEENIDLDTGNNNFEEISDSGDENSLSEDISLLLDNVGREDRVFWKDLFDGKME
ncbi:MAG: hypothetical protein ACD_11C00019G0004 [uncultured bacterium]|nr:MAG: hypothetical protein ACD_11C00019G0004 [uncultured bacterium]HBR71899.1 hypothetical protein [Candidatus Moranbacteria bacterium]